MVSELVAIHAELRAAIAALQSVVAQPVPNSEALAAARLRLTRVSSRRRSLIERQIWPLLEDAAPGDARRIADLRTETATLLVQSSEHIGRWTIAAILADWPGYQRASARMVATMLRRIADESAVLYPLLTAKAAQQVA